MYIKRTALAMTAAIAMVPAGLPAATAVPAQATQQVAVRAAGTAPTAAPTAALRRFKNCAALNRVYKHGVGKRGAVDRAAGKRKAKPVRNFTVNTRLYNAQPRRLDRDRDGIACERHFPPGAEL